jgi:hypothetical protein
MPVVCGQVEPLDGVTLRFSEGVETVVFGSDLALAIEVFDAKLGRARIMIPPAQHHPLDRKHLVAALSLGLANVGVT